MLMSEVNSTLECTLNDIHPQLNKFEHNPTPWITGKSVNT
jgi:hypothetical protein